MPPTPIETRLVEIRSELTRLADIHVRHEGEDDRRFTEERREREESVRRMYTRLDTWAENFEKRLDIKIGEMGLKVDTVVTKVVAKVEELDKARTFADGRAAGLVEGKTPGPWRKAIIQGASGQLTIIIVSICAGLIALAATTWVKQVATPAASHETAATEKH